MRLGALIAQVEGAAALARRAQRAADKELNAKASRRLRAEALAAASRVSARDAALAVATEAVRWVAGADGDARRARAAPRPRVDPPRPGRPARRPRAGQRRRLRAHATVTRLETRLTDDRSLDNAAAIVGVGAILPDAPDAAAFWRNVTTGRYSISEVDPERWDPALYYDPDPKAPEKHVLEDRRLGARMGVGSARPGSSRSRPRSATRWTTPTSGPSPARAWR